MTDFTELAEMQFARITSTEQRALLRRIFYTLEYDSEGAPGVEHDSDVTQAISELFGAYGVTFTNPDFAPAQFRYNDHRDTRGQQCPHALQPAPPPDQWGAKIDPPWCPNGRVGSAIEGHAPDTEPEPEPAAGRAFTTAQPTPQHADDTTADLMKLDNSEPTAVGETEVAS
ncbi:hypothetical protein GCM10020358_69040 [Amorphoplanes nipponensis]|uniref:Uncharacterized protein n=1 Tax=Actinoplanes nipponensis TaxID=135950 RepID=A0A919JPZ4_9ACTN|nr:hypothetical protein [Actinoplanes nipponensis]GIE53205.1 hypothetical protein Ani05nite_67390 [Actinoplanes nipponensis]